MKNRIARAGRDFPKECIAAFTALLLFSAAAQSAEITPLQLDQAQRAAIEMAACRDRHDLGVEKIEGRVYGQGENASAVAEVHCISHGVFIDNPMHYVVQCTREQRQWLCQGEWTEIIVAAQSDPITVRVEGEIPLGVSYLTINKLAGSGSFQGYPLREALASPCYVHKGTTKEFIDVRCEGWHIIVSLWCPQDDCPRVFSIDKMTH